MRLQEWRERGPAMENALDERVSEEGLTGELRRLGIRIRIVGTAATAN